MGSCWWGEAGLKGSKLLGGCWQPAGLFSWKEAPSMGNEYLVVEYRLLSQQLHWGKEVCHSCSSHSSRQAIWGKYCDRVVSFSIAIHVDVLVLLSMLCILGVLATGPQASTPLFLVTIFPLLVSHCSWGKVFLYL